MWQRGIEKVTKRYKLAAAARNLGLIMRKLFGVGQPRCLQGLGVLFCALFCVIERLRDGSCVAQDELSKIHRAPRSPRANLKSDQFAFAGI